MYLALRGATELTLEVPRRPGLWGGRIISLGTKSAMEGLSGGLSNQTNSLLDDHLLSTRPLPDRRITPCGQTTHIHIPTHTGTHTHTAH